MNDGSEGDENNMTRINENVRIKSGYSVRFRDDNFKEWSHIFEYGVPSLAACLEALIFQMRKYGRGFYKVDAVFTNGQKQQVLYLEFKGE